MRYISQLQQAYWSIPLPKHAAKGRSPQPYIQLSWYCVAGHLFGQLEGTLAPVPLSCNWVPRGDHSNWFWLSGGSVRPDALHRLCYKMAHDVCVVHSISLQVLKADFHQVQLRRTVSHCRCVVTPLLS